METQRERDLLATLEATREEVWPDILDRWGAFYVQGRCGAFIIRHAGTGSSGLCFDAVRSIGDVMRDRARDLGTVVGLFAINDDASETLVATADRYGRLEVVR